MPTRAQQKAITREALLTAAFEAFATSGIEGASLDAISAAAGRTRGAFYVHFDDREALLDAVVVRAMDDYLTALGRQLADGGDLTSIIEAFADLLREAGTEDSKHGRFMSLSTTHFHVVLEAVARSARTRALFDAALRNGVDLLVASTVADRALATTLVTVVLGLLAVPIEDRQQWISDARDVLIALSRSRG